VKGSRSESTPRIRPLATFVAPALVRILAGSAVVLGCLSCGARHSEVAGRPAGHLEPSVIQAAVRESYGEVRRCYELGLAKDKTLTGRVIVRFVITPDGKVIDAVDADSELRDPDVVTCIVKVVSTIVFPQPEGGSVTVFYPIMLAPG
jgi:hypothetical protein